MRFLPRTRAARLAAELAEIRDLAARAEDEACRAGARADEILSRMGEQTRTRPALSLAHSDDRPGAA